MTSSRRCDVQRGSRWSVLAILLAVTAACGDDDAPSLDGSVTDAPPADARADVSLPDDGGEPQDATIDGGATDTPRCAPLSSAGADVIRVGPADDLAATIADAPEGATVELAAGTYDVGASGLWVRADGVTIRGAGAREAVVLDGGYRQTSGGLVNVQGRRDVTIAHLTIRRARYHAVHVTGGPMGASLRTRLYDVHLVDPGEQAVKINSNHGFDSDEGEVACSLIELSDEGRAQVMGYTSSGSNCYTGGVDAHRARGWAIRDNEIRGFWCSNGDISQHAVHFWRGSRDTLVERNRIVDNARGIGFGLGRPSSGRTFDDAPCADVENAEHYGGVIRNNVVLGLRPALFDSPNGMDLGVGLESACGAVVVHNTVASVRAPFSSFEWRFDVTSARLVNNLTTHNLRPRDGADATLVGNVDGVDAGVFVDLTAGDVRLRPEATVAPGDAEGTALAPTDHVEAARGGAPDPGALQR